MDKQAMAAEVRGWMIEAAQQIRENFSQKLEIVEKASRTDIVTNMDKATQEFLIQKIQTSYPDDQIMGEEEGYSELASMAGRVWVIDPIDGTLNFVKEQENFCIMMAFYIDGVGQLGFILDVMRDEFYWGGSEIGVYVNDERLAAPEMLELSDGLLGVNGWMYGHNISHARDIGEVSMGVRVSGCAGLEFIAMLKGNHIGYVSNLCPWDYAAGSILTSELGFRFSRLDGQELSFNGREFFLAATPNAYREIQTRYFS